MTVQGPKTAAPSALTAVAPASPQPRWWQVLAAGLLHGLLVALSQPPFSLWALALLAPAPLLWVADRAAARPRRRAVLAAAALAALGTLPMWAGEHLWLIRVTAPGYPGLVALLTFWTFLTIAGIALLRRAAPRLGLPLAAALVWPGVEMLRGDVFLGGYAWFMAAQPLIDWPAFAATAGLGGVYFASALVVGFAAALVQSAHTRPQPGAAPLARWRPVLAAGVVVAASMLAAWLLRPAYPESPERTVRFGVVQTNLPQDNKLGWSQDARARDLLKWIDLSRDLAGSPAGRPDLIVWPETMFPGLTLSPPAVETVRATIPNSDAAAFYDRLLADQQALGIPMLVGASAYEGLTLSEVDGRLRIGFDARFNAAFLLQSGAVAGRYDKIQLTPFGEVIPVAWRFPSVQQRLLNLGAAGMAFDLRPGAEADVFDLPYAASTAGPLGDGSPPTVRLVAPICFEATYARLCRRLATEGGVLSAARRADILVNMSNDGWFNVFAAGRRQHLLTARWRCVELDLPMVRSVNTGVSGWIDRFGRIRAAGPEGQSVDIDVEGTLLAEVPFAPRTAGVTLFARVGWLFGWVALVLAALAVPWAALVGRRPIPAA